MTGAALLTIGYLLVRHNLHERHTLRENALRRALEELFPGSSHVPQYRPGAQSIAVHAAEEAGYRQAAADALHRLLIEYVAALLVMTGASIAAGWWMAGRALAPLRAITATARRVSGQNLGERIDLQGPADELRQLADTFDGMLERLDAAFASQRHFVANASHELRTPLAIMRTEVDVTLADSDAGATELRAMGETVRETIDRSEALIAALLTLARSEAISGHEEAVDLAALAGDCITDLHSRAETAEVSIDDDLGPAVAVGDARLLERMLINLVDNGIRHNHAGGRLRVLTTTVGAHAQVLVANGGAVIDPEQVQTLTDPFRRLTRTPGGFGLGLSIVRTVAEAHGGSVTLTAPPGGGLEVLVSVPAQGAGEEPRAPRRRRTLTRS
ncbi:MAG: sensor histidine kinase [Solirubrobacteraceae bacterium]